jgi:hypothetical protein
MMCRWAPSPTSQLQIFSEARFSSLSILIESLQLYPPALEQAVKTSQYATHAAKALKKPPYIPTDDDTPKDLRERSSRWQIWRRGSSTLEHRHQSWLGARNTPPSI